MLGRTKNANWLEGWLQFSYDFLDTDNFKMRSCDMLPIGDCTKCPSTDVTNEKEARTSEILEGLPCIATKPLEIQEASRVIVAR